MVSGSRWKRKNRELLLTWDDSRGTAAQLDVWGTLCGEWLLALIKHAWPEWQEHLYAGYKFVLPPVWEK